MPSFVPRCRSYFGGAPFQVTPSDGEAELTTGGDTETDTSWEALLAAAQRGDAAAYRRFLESILPFARGVARRRVGSEGFAEDIVQDALLTIHRVRHTYQPGRPVKPWLAAIVTRRAIDAVRKHGRTLAREVHDAAAYETFADPEANNMEGADSAATVARMMAELTPNQREAVELVKLKEMSLMEASAASGQSIGSLKVNVHRAIRKLRRGFGGSGE